MADKEFHFDAMAQLIRELHCLKYTDDLIRQQAQVDLGPDIRVFFRQAENPPLRATRLNDFSDKRGYNGVVPSAQYLSLMYKSMHKKYEPTSTRNSSVKLSLICWQLMLRSKP
jgi:hypothetical protein